MIKPIAVHDTRRASRRQNFMIRAAVSSEAGQQHAGRVRDLSAEGLKIELDDAPVTPMKRGETVFVEMRGIGRVKASIVWRRSHWYGVRFDRPIKPERAVKSVGARANAAELAKLVVVPGRASAR